MTRKHFAKQHWTEGYRAQTQGKRMSDNPLLGRARAQWFEGYATAERETFVPIGVVTSSPYDYAERPQRTALKPASKI